MNNAQHRLEARSLALFPVMPAFVVPAAIHRGGSLSDKVPKQAFLIDLSNRGLAPA